MTYIFNKTDIILAQSETYVDLIKTKVKNKKKIFFSHLGQKSRKKISNSDELLLTKIDNNYLNIFFTGSVGDAQNYKVLIKIINKTKNLKIKWYIIGGGRRFNELIKIKSLYDLFNLELIDHIPLSEIYNYQKK